MLQLPNILLLVIREHPACGPSIFSPLRSSLFKHLVAQQEIVCVNFGLFAQAFEAQPKFLLKLAHQSISDITSFALLRGATKTINAVGYTFAKLSIKRGHIPVGIVCSITHKTFLSKFCICVASWLVEKRYSKDVVCVRIPHHPFPTLWVYLRIAPCSFYHLRPIHAVSYTHLTLPTTPYV